MYRYCPQHGEQLTEVGDYREFWFCVYECPQQNCCGYIELADGRHLPILVRLEEGTLRSLETASRELIEVAVSRIKQIDYKTVSIIYFEQTLQGSYRTGNEYRVVYPDGSSK